MRSTPARKGTLPNRKKIVLPVLAAVALVLLLWLAFHDRSVAATLRVATCAHSSLGVDVSPS